MLDHSKHYTFFIMLTTSSLNSELIHSHSFASVILLETAPHIASRTACFPATEQ